MPARLIVIGHLGFESVQTPNAERRSLGGSAYYTALGAALSGADVSVIGVVGDDYPLDTLRDLNVDVAHVSVVKGASPQFDIRYLPTLADRTLELDLGVGGVIRIPDELDFSDVRYAHVATNLPQMQLEVIERLRVVAPTSDVTVDCFDQFVVAYPKATCRVVAAADLVFLNLVEYELVQQICGAPAKPMVVKKGDRGAVTGRARRASLFPRRPRAWWIRPAPVTPLPAPTSRASLRDSTSGPRSPTRVKSARRPCSPSARIF
jgi:sugar/nucleoside kinase (ribokinase family)